MFSGAFLIPYFIMMVIEGIPLFYIEFAVGQRFRRSAVGCWKRIHPALTGVGTACIVISMLLCIYYISVIAWCFYYFFVSFTSKLPWRVENCPEWVTSILPLWVFITHYTWILIIILSKYLSKHSGLILNQNNKSSP